MKKFISIFLLLALRASAQGTFTPASAAYHDVNACVNSDAAGSCSPARHTAVNGDTIQIPAGSATWTSVNLVVPAGVGISLIGNGTPNNTTSTQGASSSCATGTVITLVSSSFIKATPNLTTGAPLTHISCVALPYGSGGSIAFAVGGTCTASDCPKIRLDNVTFNNWAGHTSGGISYGIGVLGDMFGVVDHNTVNGTTLDNQFLQFAEISHASYLGVGQFGDNSWAQPENYGSQNFIYFENNIMSFASCCENEGNVSGLTSEGGTRVVVRFNTVTGDHFNAALLWHGTESSGRPRGGRVWEAYANTFTCNSSVNHQCGGFVVPRSGTGLTWGNSFTLSFFTNNITQLTTLRMDGNINWSSCDGAGVYDTNDGVTYYSDTIGSYNSSTHVITVSGTPGWTANQWIPVGAPYSVHDVTKVNGTEITANGSNTLTVNLGNGGPQDWTPLVGDSIQILRATVCMDQTGGRGAGRLFSGSNSFPNAMSPTSPANQALSPVYVWGNPISNTGNLGVMVATGTGRVIRNRDWYQENANQTAQTTSSAPFDGTTTIGMGWGTLARRPSTCTAGVGYWAGDQGSWNTTNTTIPGTTGFTQGQLYLCGPANTWTLSYTPLTYPHPLINGATAPIATFSPASLNVGQVPQNLTTNPSAVVTLTNTGSANLVATQITMTNVLYLGVNNTCGTSTSFGLVSPGAGFTLTPGASCQFQVTFSPTAIGVFGGAVLVTDNTSSSPDTLILSGTSTGPAAPTVTIFAGEFKTSSLCPTFTGKTAFCFADDCACWWTSINGGAYKQLGVSSVNGKRGTVVLSIQ